MAPIKTDLKDKTYRHQGFQKQCPATKNCKTWDAKVKPNYWCKKWIAIQK